MEGLTQLLLEYRYWILFPLACAEGPMLAFIAGMLASLGYFNLALLFGIFVVADIVTDVFYYLLGRGGATLRFVRRLEKRFGITQEKLEKSRMYWQDRTLRAMLISKFAWGLGPVLLAAAGYVRMPLPHFLRYSAPLSIVQYTVLLGLGYYLGSYYSVVESTLVRGQLFVTAALVFAAVYYFGMIAFRKIFVNGKKY